MKQQEPLLPARTQLELVWEFVSSFVGSACEDEGQVTFKTGLTHDGVTVVSEREVHELFERWLRERRDEIIDYMVESECAVEDPPAIVERWCPRATAHGGPHRIFNDDGSVDYECPGIKAHPKTQIGKGEGPKIRADTVMSYATEEEGRAGTNSNRPITPISTHRNTQVLRDLGHDL